MAFASFIRQHLGYTPVPQDGSDAQSPSSPSLGAVARSKRFRLAALVAILLLFLFLTAPRLRRVDLQGLTANMTTFGGDLSLATSLPDGQASEAWKPALLDTGMSIPVTVAPPTSPSLSAQDAIFEATPIPTSTETTIPSTTSKSSSGVMEETIVDWSKFAYTQYVTNQAYLCNSVMIFESLHRFGSKADRLMMYPEEWDALEKQHSISKLLEKAKTQYNVKMAPIQVVQLLSSDPGSSTWSESFTKLLAFNQTAYQRVLSVDSDSTILQVMDELFFLPPCPVALPRAYWGDTQLSSQLLLISPSDFEFSRIVNAIKNKAANEYDMEIVNRLYKDSAMILPHRRYDLLTGEFRGNEHEKYLGSPEETWDPDKVLAEAKFVHFSDWPIPKPWIKASKGVLNKDGPKCHDNYNNGQQDCRDRDIWYGLYDDFAKRRQDVCGIPLEGVQIDFKTKRVSGIYAPVL